MSRKYKRDNRGRFAGGSGGSSNGGGGSVRRTIKTASSSRAGRTGKVLARGVVKAAPGLAAYGVTRALVSHTVRKSAAGALGRY